MCGANFLPEGLVVLGEAAGFSIFVLRTLTFVRFGAPADRLAHLWFWKTFDLTSLRIFDVSSPLPVH